jgi:hypothetical protein
MPRYNIFKDEDQQEVLDYLESIDAAHFKQGIFTIILAYCQDHVEMGMHTCLDRKFYTDMESLFNILSVRQKYPHE